MRNLRPDMVLRAAIALALLSGAACSGAVSSASRPLPASVPAANKAKSASNGHSMWLWPGGSYPPAATVMAWCTANGVSNVFLYAYARNGHLQHLRELQAYAEAAPPAGVTLYALNGDASWIEHPNNAVAWENAVNKSGLFSGIHMDTEPNQVPGWKAYDKPGAVQADAPIIKHFYTMLHAVRANSPSTHIEVDVQFADADYSKALGFPTDGYDSFGEALVAETDALTVMSYRTVLNGNNGLLEISAPMLALAVAHGKPMRLAIETTKDSADPQDSFWGQPQSAVTTMLQAIDNAEASSTAYDGTSVEDYKAWAELKRS
jgi:hypothetical protein